MRLRKQIITDLELNDKDLVKLSNGYVVYKRANNHAHSIRVIRAKDKVTKKIEALEAKLAALRKEVPSGKRPYNKKDMEHWAKGGNARFM